MVLFVCHEVGDLSVNGDFRILEIGPPVPPWLSYAYGAIPFYDNHIKNIPLVL